jgi:hypothetical protein
VKTYRKLLIILWMLMTGCAVGGFDITQPLIKTRPEAAEMAPERILWRDLEPGKFNQELMSAERCAIVYIRQSAGCSDCYAMDESFEDEAVVRLVKRHFHAYKSSEDMPGWERSLKDFDVNHTPAVYIYYHKTFFPYLVESHEGYLDVNGLIGILIRGLGVCS